MYVYNLETTGEVIFHFSSTKVTLTLFQQFPVSNLYHIHFKFLFVCGTYNDATNSTKLCFLFHCFII